MTFPARESPRKMGGSCVSPPGNPIYLDPKRASEAFKEESVWVAKLRRGPGEPQSDSWNLTDDPTQTLTAQLGKQRPREGLAYISRDLNCPLGCKAVSDPAGMGTGKKGGLMGKKQASEFP